MMLGPQNATPSPLFIRPLEPDRIAQAFPLVAACDPRITLETWQSLASGGGSFATRQRRAVFSAETAGDRIRGVCAVASGAEAEADLVIEQFALCRIGRHAVATALHGKIAALARQWGCPGVRFALSTDADWLGAFLVDEGYGAITQSLLRWALYPYGAGSPTTRH